MVQVLFIEESGEGGERNSLGLDVPLPPHLLVPVAPHRRGCVANDSPPDPSYLQVGLITFSFGEEKLVAP
jgi:hypothetical protein